jgi:feruloyl esterase
MMIGAYVKGDNRDDWTKFQLDPSKVGFTRPVYPYPTRAKYKGKGDPNDAANFGPLEQ